jgi:hypothetical protein
LTKATRHFRANAIAYLALMVALGGTSYAAVNLPAGSVGAKQLKNHSITQVKLDPQSIGAVVRYWAVIDPSGRVIASRPKARIVIWGGRGGSLTWGRRIPSGCFSLATVDGFSPPEGAQVGFASTAIIGDELAVGTFAPSGAPDAKRVNVAVLCP